MISRAREIIEEQFDDEFLQLEEDLRNGVISQEQYDKYSRNLNQQYREEIAELKE